MYYFYADESGTCSRSKSALASGDWLYVLAAVSLFEHRWHKFEKFLRRRKRTLGEEIYRATGTRLGLADYEMKSNWIRNPKARAEHAFLSQLDETQLHELVDAFYRQLDYHNMYVFAVVVDKRHLRSYMDHTRTHRKAWELLLERIQFFMKAKHGKHQAVIVADDVTRQTNMALAEKLVYLQDQGTSSGCWLTNISGLPLFTKSELSNGIQLADLCAYNIYRAFVCQDLGYPFFERIAPYIWRSQNSGDRCVEGLKVFPDESPLVVEKQRWEKRPRLRLSRGLEMVSSGANPIEPARGTGRIFNLP